MTHSTQIGLMRSGRLLAEESPACLLSIYRCSSLEDVFLKLSRKQGQQNTAPAELNIRFVSLVRPLQLTVPILIRLLLPQNSNNISLSALAFGKAKDNPVYVSQESGVVGLNFHQSKEVLISDSNGSAYGVSTKELIIFRFSKHRNRLFAGDCHVS